MPREPKRTNRPRPPANIKQMRVAHVIPPDHEVVLPRGLVFRAFRRELLERFSTSSAPDEGES